MRDPVNPTHAELEAWARTPGAMCPMEDWDLMVAVDENSALLVRLAADSTCVNREAMLNFLYVYAGQVVRGGQYAESVAALSTAIAQAEASRDPALVVWAQRARAVLDGKGPDPRSGASRSDYAFWFGYNWKRARAT